MTDFGDKMKDILAFAEGDTENKPKVKARKEKVVTYDIQASGIDVIITRILNDKPTRTLAVFFSKLTEDNKPTVILKDKNTIVEITDATLRSFLDGAESSITVDNCTSIPILRQGASFIRALKLAFFNENWCKLIRLGLANTDIIHEICGDSWNRPEYWCASVDRWNGPDEITLYEDNFHIKMVRHAIGYMMKELGMDYNEALKTLLTSDRTNNYYRKKVIDCGLFQTFIVLANRYDEPFAMKCMDEYLDTDNLSGFSAADTLDKLFRIKNNAKYAKDNRYYDDLKNTYVTGFLKTFPLRKESEDEAVKFDKNRVWEYLLSSVAVGKGRDLASYVSLWKDYLLMDIDIHGSVTEKYPEHLQIAHDICQEKYEINKDEKVTEGLKKHTEEASKICDVNCEGYQLRILRTVDDFIDEANQQSNCVASYMERCSRGETLVASFRQKDAPRTQVTVELTPDTYMMIQIKGRFNREPTNKEKEILDKMQKIIYKNEDKAMKEQKEEETPSEC